MRSNVQDIAVLGTFAALLYASSVPAQDAGAPVVEAADSNQVPTASDSAQTVPGVSTTEPAAVAVEPAATVVPEPVVSRERPSAGIGIEEIVVTAQRRSENINDVPIAISAFSGDDLKALGIADTRNLGNVVPGFTVADSGYNTPIYTLRGVGFNDSTYTATSTVGVYEDEISLPYAVMTKGPALDLERVEVLKGPQGILYGRNTTGGAINYIVKKPTDTFEAGLSETVARFGTTETEGYVSGPILEGLNGRLAVKDVRSQTGWQYSNTRPEDRLGEKDKQAFRAALEWKGTEDLVIRGVVNGWRDRSDPQAAQVIEVRQQNGLDPTGVLFLPPQARNYPVIPVNGANPQVADWPEGERWQLNDSLLSESLRADWQISDRTSFTGIASHLRVESDNTTVPASGYNYNAFEQALFAHIETTSAEARFAGTLGEEDSIEWLVGGNMSRDRGYEDHIELADFQSALLPDPITGRSLLTNRPEFVGRVQIDQAAAFMNFGWKLAEDLKLTTGARYTKQKQDAYACSFVSPTADYDLLSPLFTAVISPTTAAQYTLQTGQPGRPSIVTTGNCFSLAPDGSNDPYVNQLKEDNVAWRVALDYKPTDDGLVYASVGKGFKAGGYPVLGASSQVQFAPVKQEELLAYEIGSKVGLLNKQLHFNTSLYYYDYKDKQLLAFTKDPFFGPLPLLNSAPKSEVYGAELDVQYAPAAISGLFVSLTGAYTHTEIKEFVAQDSGGDEYDYKGRPFNFAPKWQSTLVVNYTHPLNNDVNLTLGGDYSYTGSTSSSLDPDPIFRHDDYALLGARIGLSGDRWSATAFGRNLTNEMYATTILAFGDSVHRYVGEPRMYGLTLRYDWY